MSHVPNCRIFLGNLASEKTSAEELRQIFERYGEIEEIVMRKSFGFVQFAQPGSAEQAIKGEAGRMIGGIRVDVNLADNRDFRKKDDNNYRGSHKRRSPSPRGGRDDRYRKRSSSPRGNNNSRRSPSPRKRSRRVVVQIIYQGTLLREFSSQVENILREVGFDAECVLVERRSVGESLDRAVARHIRYVVVLSSRNQLNVAVALHILRGGNPESIQDIQLFQAIELLCREEGLPSPLSRLTDNLSRNQFVVGGNIPSGGGAGGSLLNKPATFGSAAPIPSLFQPNIISNNSNTRSLPITNQFPNFDGNYQQKQGGNTYNTPSGYQPLFGAGTNNDTMGGAGGFGAGSSGPAGLLGSGGSFGVGGSGTGLFGVSPGNVGMSSLLGAPPGSLGFGGSSSSVGQPGNSFSGTNQQQPSFDANVLSILYQLQQSNPGLLESLSQATSVNKTNVGPGVGGGNSSGSSGFHNQHAPSAGYTSNNNQVDTLSTLQSILGQVSSMSTNTTVVGVTNPSYLSTQQQQLSQQQMPQQQSQQQMPQQQSQQQMPQQQSQQQMPQQQSQQQQSLLPQSQYQQLQQASQQKYTNPSAVQSRLNMVQPQQLNSTQQQHHVLQQAQQLQQQHQQPQQHQQGITSQYNNVIEFLNQQPNLKGLDNLLSKAPGYTTAQQAILQQSQQQTNNSNQQTTPLQYQQTNSSNQQTTSLPQYQPTSKQQATTSLPYQQTSYTQQQPPSTLQYQPTQQPPQQQQQTNYSNQQQISQQNAQYHQPSYPTPQPHQQQTFSNQQTVGAANQQQQAMSAASASFMAGGSSSPTVTPRVFSPSGANAQRPGGNVGASTANTANAVAPFNRQTPINGFRR